MKQFSKTFVLWIGIVAAGGLVSDGNAEEGRWFASVYGGRFSDNAFLEILAFQTEIKDSEIYVFSIGKELGRFGNKLAYEVEGQLAFHDGMQSHEEINAVFALRWLPLPWDRYVDTSIAFANGLSYATEKPPLERKEQDDNDASNLLYYLYAEVAFEPLKDAPVELFVRVHHRSGIFGLINGIDSGSNFLGLGVRYYF